MNGFSHPPLKHVPKKDVTEHRRAENQSVHISSMRPPTTNNSDFPAISIVVIGRNEGSRLQRCLESIRSCSYPADKLDVIYVDSDSTDESCDNAERWGARVVRIRPARPCAAAGRNAGWRAARHELVHFLDGDTILDVDWLSCAVKAMSSPDIVCVFGRREEIAADATVFNFWAHHDWYVPPGPAESCAGDALFRRSALERASGYDESLIAGEEPDLCYRIRRDPSIKVLSLNRPMTRHDMNMTRWRQYWKRCMRTGHAYAEVGGRHRGMTRWRVARWRNLLYAFGTPASVVASLASWSYWPAISWMMLVGAAVVRNAFRVRGRIGGMRDALLYSLHHYISKTPAACGQILYWIRRAARREPQPLMEYRGHD